MAYDTLRDFIAVLEKNGELVRIKAEVDAELEIAEITDRVSKEKGAANKALLFERVTGSAFPVLTNAFGSMKRMCLALEVESLDEIGQRIKESSIPRTFSRVPAPGFMDKLQSAAETCRTRQLFPQDRQKSPVSGRRSDRRPGRPFQNSGAQVLAC